MNHLHYRADIDGLRAVAVLAVIIYHCNASWLPGGFVGVDIFFVISGFLITAIISQQMHRQHFSVMNFYARRVRRILPPFYAMVVLVLLAGFFLLLPRDYAGLAHSARYALLFFSNHYFAAGNDYFAPASAEMPLLHTWSLAVEEQYYIVWPLLLLFLLRYAGRGLQLWSAVLAVASFLLATWMALEPALAGRAYYWMPGRFGELLVGGMLALYLAGNRPVSAWAARLAGICGLLLVAGSCLLLNDRSLFPGINALWPCLGAALLIYAGSTQARPWASRLLAVRPLVFTGLLSYSLYLWHWPILAFSRYQAAAAVLSLGQIAVAVGLTVVAAYLSWRFVETPARRHKIGNRQVFLRYFWLPMLLLLVMAEVIKHSEGYLWRQDKNLHSLESPALTCHNRIRPPCLAGAPGKKPAALMYGDSHAAHFTSYIDLLAKQQEMAVIVASADSCPLFSSSGFANLLHDKRRAYCSHLAGFVSEQEAAVNTIIIALRWDVHLGFTTQGSDYQPAADFLLLLEKKLDDYAAQGKRVYLLAQIPRFREPVLRMHYIGRSGDNLVDPVYARANQVLAGLAARHPSVRLVDFSPSILAWDNGIYQGKPAYLDDNHLNLYGQQALFEVTRSQHDWLVPGGAHE